MIYINLIGDDYVLAQYRNPEPLLIPDLKVVPDNHDPRACKLTGTDSDTVPYMLLEHLRAWVLEHFRDRPLTRWIPAEMTAMMHAELYLMLERGLIFRAYTGKWVLIENWWEHMPKDYVYYLNDSNKLSPNLPSQY